MVTGMDLTVAYITSRKEPKVEWFFDSLNKQADDPPQVIVISIFPIRNPSAINAIWKTKELVRVFPPKPTIWQGKHRITKEDWWAKSNAMNTAICLCKTGWIAFVDDRCVLGNWWLRCVKEAMAGGYAVCGSYEKRANMVVENGEIIDEGELLGEDDRQKFSMPVPTRDFYGGSYALPLEWCLAVNGWSEDVCDSLGSEDSMFGVTLRNSGFPMKYDSRMRIIEDRTPGEIGGALKRADKRVESGRGAKSWAIVRIFHDKTSSQNSYDIRQHRARVMNGEDLNSIMPSANHFDWFDGQPISEM